MAEISAARAQLAIAAESALPHEVSFSLATTAGCTARGGSPGTHESHVYRCGKAGDASIRLESVNAAAKEADACLPLACLARGTCKLRVGRHRPEAERMSRAIGICDCCIRKRAPQAIGLTLTRTMRRLKRMKSLPVPQSLITDFATLSLEA